MEVNTKELQKELRHLDLLMKDWEEIQFNLYHQLEKATDHWQDERSRVFYEKIHTEKNNTDKVLNQLKDIQEIYQYLYESYHQFGTVIYCEVTERKKVFQKMEIYVENLKKIYVELNQVDTSFAYPESNSILEIRGKIALQLKNLNDLKNKIQSFLTRVEEIEKEVSLKTSKLQNILIEDFEF